MSRAIRTLKHPPKDTAWRKSAVAIAVAVSLTVSIGMSLRVRCSAGEPAVVDSAVEEPPLTDFDRDHWAFRTLSSPALPAVRNAVWPVHPVDQFILAKLERAGLQPQPAADKVTLLRRLTFDLTGLPPSPDEMAAFQTADDPDACERVVDRLLASPAHGERMAQHWLDLARFAETDGFEFDQVRPEAWRYRDWVILAFNSDLSYDEFVKRQIAGDLLRPGEEADAIATGFLLSGPDMPDLNLQEERRHNVLNEMTATVGAVFLGLQVGCAQCHDHKYDPISQADFYRLRACFDTAELFENQPLGRVMRERPGSAGMSRVMLGGDFRRPGPAIEPGFPRICELETTPAPARRADLAEWLVRQGPPLVQRVIANRLWLWHFGAGLSSSPSDFGTMGQPPTHPELLDWLASELPRQGWSLKRMHRMIVTSATWRQASRPPTDAADRRSWQAGRARDPRNELFWHAPRRRLTGEAVRDAMLAAAGQLNRTQGGPGVMAPLPPELEATLLPGQWKTHPSNGEHRRRSVYLFVRRNLQFPLFESFDRPDALASCALRSSSTTASQALSLWNSEFSWQQARALAGRLARLPDPRDRVALAWRLALGREPGQPEVVQATRFIDQQAERLRREGRTGDDLSLPDDEPPGTDACDSAALVDFCLAIFNASEFLYLD